MVEMQLFQYNLTVLQQVVLRKHCLQNSCLVCPLCSWESEEVMHSVESSRHCLLCLVALQSTNVFDSQEAISHIYIAWQKCATMQLTIWGWVGYWVLILSCTRLRRSWFPWKSVTSLSLLLCNYCPVTSCHNNNNWACCFRKESGTLRWGPESLSPLCSLQYVVHPLRDLLSHVC